MGENFCFVVPQDPLGGIAVRDILALSDRERLAAFQALREDLAAGEAPDKADAHIEQMHNAVEIFNQVAEHLTLDSDIAKLRLKMREFDATPDRVRDGASARQLAAAYYGSWDLVKAAAIGDKLPINPTQRRQRERIARRRRYHSRHQDGVLEWLASNPKAKTIRSYDAWRAERNASLDEGERPFVRAIQVIRTLNRPWAEIVADAETGDFPKPAESASDSPEEDSLPTGADDPLDVEPATPGDFVFDMELVARRARQARDHFGESAVVFAKRCGLSDGAVRRLEAGQSPEVTFATIVRLAIGIGVSVDYFLTDDEESGLPPPPPSYKRG